MYVEDSLEGKQITGVSRNILCSSDAAEVGSWVGGYPVVRRDEEAQKISHQLVFLLTRVLGVSREVGAEFQLYSVFSVKSSLLMCLSLSFCSFFIPKLKLSFPAIPPFHISLQQSELTLPNQESITSCFRRCLITVMNCPKKSQTFTDDIFICRKLKIGLANICFPHQPGLVILFLHQA